MLLEKDKLWAEQTAGKIVAKMNWVSEKSKEKIPYSTVNGVHDNQINNSEENRNQDSINWWTNGFWGGMMWLLYHETGEERYADIARFSEEKLDKCLEDFMGLHHDVGFMWLPTAVADWRLTKNSRSRVRGLHAATLLAGRFNPIGKFIRAWNDAVPGQDNSNKGWAIIDCLMNIPLLYWASEELKDPHFKEIAMLHADTVMEHFIRPDGSVRHIVEFDTVTGEFIQDFGGQGYGQGSCWTRGQGWGLYGFILSYIHTGKQEYLDTAKRIAHYFISNIPESGLIPVDYRQPKQPCWEDATAAAIASCGLIELARHVDEPERDMYLNPALKMLKALDEKSCCYGEENDCILLNCTAAYHDDQHEFNIIYGDYYFMEAVFKLKGNDILIW